MIISITNLKGGVGKSTIAQNLAVCFAHKGLKVALVDTDTQLLVSKDWHDDRGDELPAITMEVVDQDEISKKVLALKKEHNIIIIDGTPALFELSSRAVLLSDLVVIPLLPSLEEVRTLERFLRNYEEARLTKESIGGKVEACILLNKFNKNIRIDKDVADILPKFGIPLLKTRLKDRVAYRECKIEGKGVIEYTDKKAKTEMQEMADEIATLLSNI